MSERQLFGVGRVSSEAAGGCGRSGGGGGGRPSLLPTGERNLVFAGACDATSTAARCRFSVPAEQRQGTHLRIAFGAAEAPTPASHRAPPALPSQQLARRPQALTPYQRGMSRASLMSVDDP